MKRTTKRVALEVHRATSVASVREERGRVGNKGNQVDADTRSELLRCGGLRAAWLAQLLAVRQTPWRFRTKRYLRGYAGLAVVTRSTADY